MKVGIIIGSIREGRVGESVAQWVLQQANGGRTDATYELVDLKSFDVPLLTSPTVPGAANKQYADERVQRWSAAIDSCDAYVFVTPEYNHGVPGAFKNAFDSLGSEWAGKPVAFVSYGAERGVRAVESWRQVVSNFSMVDIRNQVSLSTFDEVEDGKVRPLDRRAGELQTVLKQLVEMATRLQG